MLMYHMGAVAMQDATDHRKLREELQALLQAADGRQEQGAASISPALPSARPALALPPWVQTSLPGSSNERQAGAAAHDAALEVTR